jgi:S1-C subfamily serine protease
MTTLLSLSNELAEAVERVSGAVVAVNARPRLASTGMHWRPGIIVTADHTVRSDEDITIARPDGRTTPASLVGRDPSTDLAVLRISDADLPVASLGEPGSLQVGHIVLAVGHGPRVSWGVMSALGGRWHSARGGAIDQFLRPDLTLYPGFSGGPLVDVQGRVLGINTSGLLHQLELAIPSTTVGRVVDELVARGRVSRGFLGVGLQPVRLPEAARRAFPAASETGLIVVSVQPDGPAAQSGLLLGDILVTLDGSAVDSPEDAQAVIGAKPVGSTIAAAILRASAATELRITVGDRPSRSR